VLNPWFYVPARFQMRDFGSGGCVPQFRAQKWAPYKGPNDIRVPATPAVHLAIAPGFKYHLLSSALNEGPSTPGVDSDPSQDPGKVTVTVRVRVVVKGQGLDGG